MPLQIRYEWGNTPPPAPASLDGAHILVGYDEDEHAVTLDMPKLLLGRLLIQGPSGAGKSTLLRHLMAQCPVQWLAVDPEGEHSDLRHVMSITSKPTPALNGIPDAPALAIALRQWPRPTVLDISDLRREQQLSYLTVLINGLLEAPRSLWTNYCLVIVDEVEIFTPTDVSSFDDPTVGKRSRSALIELMTRGRKRGLIACIATHRLAQLAASVRAEARNFLIGGSSFDVDLDRAATALGWTPKKAHAILPHLPVGHFVASGPAFSKSPAIVRTPKP